MLVEEEAGTKASKQWGLQGRQGNMEHGGVALKVCRMSA